MNAASCSIEQSVIAKLFSTGFLTDFRTLQRFVEYLAAWQKIIQTSLECTGIRQGFFTLPNFSIFLRKSVLQEMPP